MLSKNIDQVGRSCFSQRGRPAQAAVAVEEIKGAEVVVSYTRKTIPKVPLTDVSIRYNLHSEIFTSNSWKMGQVFPNGSESLRARLTT